MKYEVILFDADETLFDFKRSEKVALEKSITTFNIKYDEAYHLPIYSAINKRVWQELEQGILSAEQLKTERFKRLTEKLNLTFDPNEFSNIYLNSLAEASFLLEDALEIVTYLNKKYRLVIITNGLTVVQKKRIQQSSIANYFEAVVISEEVNVSKPNQEIFRYALRRIKHENKETVLMVGDSLSSDIQGGLNFAIDTCWFNPNRSKNESNITPTFEIQSLLELKKLL
ncbi:YjjG family noncanonical pyrimidine nucleotidase [Azotosporobacter soli]|uniref:YjjG family noncanonical pyrimidine nucleotidase n=1 Tax=Azotosporobacter soli TaxID=3055040 RepID=UPI0031FE532F